MSEEKIDNKFWFVSSFAGFSSTIGAITRLSKRIMIMMSSYM